MINPNQISNWKSKIGTLIIGKGFEKGNRKKRVQKELESINKRNS